MTNDWLDLQMRTLSERVERFVALRRGDVIREAQAWFWSSHREVRPTDTARGTTSTSEAPEPSPPIGASVHGEDEMRSVDDILAEAQKALDSSIREAFSAGQRQLASDLRRKMEALFEGLAGDASHGVAGAHSQAHAQAHEGENGG